MDITEIGVDAVNDTGVLQEVPIVKTMIAIGKAGLAIKEQNLMKQTIAFINGVNSGNISEEQKSRYRQKFEDGPGHTSEELEKVQFNRSLCGKY